MGKNSFVVHKLKKAVKAIFDKIKMILKILIKFIHCMYNIPRLNSRFELHKLDTSNTEL